MMVRLVRLIGDGGAWAARWAQALCPTDDERRLRSIFGLSNPSPGAAIWGAVTQRLFPGHCLLTPDEAANFARLRRDEVRRGIAAGLLPGLQLADEGESRLDCRVAGNGQSGFADEQSVGARPVV